MDPGRFPFSPIKPVNLTKSTHVAAQRQSLRRSATLLANAAKVIPGSVNSGRRSPGSRLCIAHGDGPHLWDVDGNRYIDYHAAYGPLILGHAHPEIHEHVTRAMSSGVLYGLGVTEAEKALAERLVAHVPSLEQVLLCNSGSEATYHAIRLARAATGRTKLLRFAGPFHGFHDNVLVTPGALEAAHQHTITARFNSLAEVEATFAAHPGEIAAIIIEPIVHNAPGGTILPRAGFLAGLRALCDREGTVLIFDEVITGFRHALGGYQALCGVTPDLTTLGKAMANGFPIAAIGGKQELMELFNTHPDGDVWYGGTYNGSVPSVAAALATIAVMEREPVHERIFALGERMREGLRELVQERSLEATVGGFGSLFVLSFLSGEIRDHEDLARNDRELFLAYRRELVARGCLEIPEDVGRSHISYSHTEGDIDDSLAIAAAALDTVLETGRGNHSASRHARAR
jgi:glutamate-1-semialdehyde 2,1-aminomutase